MVRIRKTFPNINKNKSINQLYDSFLKYNLEYVIVHGGDLLFEGVIYKKDLYGMYNARIVEDLSERYRKYDALIDDGDVNVTKEKAKEHFRKDKSLLILPVVSKEGKVEYCIEKELFDRNIGENDLLHKYTILLQCGYSVGKWLQERNVRSVNLIGAPQFIVPLYNDLKENQISINYIIDHQHFEMGGVKSRNWGKLTGEELDKSDANIVLYLNTKMVLLDTIKIINSQINTWVVSDIVNQLFDEVAYCGKLLGLIRNWRQKGVAFEYFRYPKANDILNKSSIEKYMCDKEIIPSDYRRNFEIYKELIIKQVGYDDLDENIDKYLVNLVTPIINKGGTIELQDMHSKYINIVNGKRIVTDQPNRYENTVYLVGPSWVFGKYEKDSDTMASCMQRKLNESNMQYRVVNCGISGVHWQKMLNNMSDLRTKKGDVVILVDADDNLENYLENHNIHINRKLNFIQRPHSNGEIFADRDHLNAKGVSLFAESLFKKTFVEFDKQEKLSLNGIKVVPENFLFQIDCADEAQWKFQNELEAYINALPEVRKSGNGAIVMNCNPFTRGHRYLVENAAKQVDTLYVFVVEEDKSFFPFEDRLMLVQKGVKDMSNVIVLPSGKFIISSLTFPEYFTKEDNKDVVIDTSMDLWLFGEKIAPKLEITKRFAGTELNDPVTAQYNREMAKYLPDYGIDFIEIPRAERNGIPISASLVRKYLVEKNWGGILELVPESTYEYLFQKYN